MKHRLSVISAACSLIVAVLACNAPTAQQAGQPDYQATITAQAAIISQSGSQATAATTSGAAVTGTPSTVTANVTASTNCRSGPGTAYGVVSGLSVGQTVTVVGKDTPDNYWIVDEPGGGSTCWLWGQVATVTGNTAALPDFSPSPAPTPKATRTPKPTATSTQSQAKGPPPAAPQDFGAQQLDSCLLTSGALGGYNLTYKGGLGWDPEPNVTGYRIYQGATLLVDDTNPGSIYASVSGIVIGAKQKSSVSFGIVAYNANGSSPRVDAEVSCP